MYIVSEWPNLFSFVPSYTLRDRFGFLISFFFAMVWAFLRFLGPTDCGTVYAVLSSTL